MQTHQSDHNRPKLVTKMRTLFCAVLLGSTQINSAQLLINVGSQSLQPNQSGQAIDFFVQNAGGSAVLVAGLSFNVQVADSGPTPGLGSIDGPDITAVNIISGTVFQSNPNGQIDAGSVPQFANFTTDLPSGTVSLNAGATTKIATVTFDTTGFLVPQTWDLRLGNTINGQTKYFDSGGGDILPTITDGSLSVVPEPRANLMVAAILATFAVWRRTASGASPSTARRENHGGPVD